MWRCSFLHFSNKEPGKFFHVRWLFSSSKVCRTLVVNKMVYDFSVTLWFLFIFLVYLWNFEWSVASWCSLAFLWGSSFGFGVFTNLLVIVCFFLESNGKWEQCHCAILNLILHLVDLLCDLHSLKLFVWTYYDAISISMSLTPFWYCVSMAGFEGFSGRLLE